MSKVRIIIFWVCCFLLLLLSLFLLNYRYYETLDEKATRQNQKNLTVDTEVDGNYRGIIVVINEIIFHWLIDSLIDELTD